MKHEKIRRISTISLIIFLFLTIVSFVLCIGGGGVLNDLYSALDRVQDLEKNNLLSSSSSNISSIAKREIELVHDSAGLKKYINETHMFLSAVEITLFIFVGLSFVALFMRIYFRKKL